ncbi:hypothetical protein N7539_007288 [Penicillium diatomitis]|uniref:PHD-type domain-containing protein n=1 Tax=Penicillium diatomitis TaxID=2819901 RepID=A0A9W9WUU9_9EURO|nr:uncharacterized protein N7539_007288 [Penicillium diatomitis]KAJ5477144.1 hypothetical protein N7539_007288 [Penicillium diatomitis]
MAPKTLALGKTSLARTMAAHPTGAVVTSTNMDTRTSRTGRVIKAPTAFVPPPTVATTGKRKGVSRKKESNVVCIHCNRGHSPASNAIVFCDGCNNTWHQKCHNPSIDNRVILMKDMEWHCIKCKPVGRPKAARTKTAKTKKATRTLHPRLQAAPQLEVGGEQFTPDERRAYLSGLSHAQLVELLVNVSSRNPTVPMFPVNLKQLPASQFFLRPNTPEPTNHQTTTLESKQRSAKRSRSESDVSDATPNSNSAKKRRTSTSTELSLNNASSAPGESIAGDSSASMAAVPGGLTTSANSSPVNGSSTPAARKAQTRRVSFSLQDTPSVSPEPQNEDEIYEDAVEDHRLYPDAGNGFMPMLDSGDMKLLTESSHSQTFSHELHGPAKMAQDAGRPPPVWQGLN